MNRIYRIFSFFVLLAATASDAGDIEKTNQQCIRIFQKNLFLPTSYHIVPVDRSLSSTGLFDLRCYIDSDCDLNLKNEMNDLGGVTISVGERPASHIEAVKTNRSFHLEKELSLGALNVGIYRFSPVENAEKRSKISYAIISDSTNYIGVLSNSDNLWQELIDGLRKDAQCN